MKLISIATSEAQTILHTDSEYLPGGFIDDISVIFDTDENETLEHDGIQLVFKDDNDVETRYTCFYTTADTNLPVQAIKCPITEEQMVEVKNQSFGPVFLLEISENSTALLLVA